MKQYQVQFKDYSVWEDFLDTQDDQEGLYNTEEEAQKACEKAKERYPMTEFCYEER